MSSNTKFYSYLTFGNSKDELLIKFLKLITCKYSYKESEIDGILSVCTIKNSDPLSLENFLNTIHSMNDYLNLTFICELILKYIQCAQQRIEYQEYGCIIYKNFVKYNMSLKHRLNTIKSLIMEEI